jgi:hypothetical protein
MMIATWRGIIASSGLTISDVVPFIAELKIQRSGVD